MVGLLRWNQEGRFLRPIPLREVKILHVRFLCADMSRGERMSAAAERRKLRSAGKKLLRQGIERVVLPSDVPADALPEGRRPAGTLSLRRAIAADWCGALLRLRGENPAAARVLVTANALSGEVVRTVTELALRHRYLLMAGRNCAVVCGGNTACHCCCIPAPGRRRIFSWPLTWRSAGGRASCRCTMRRSPCPT